MQYSARANKRATVRRAIVDMLTYYEAMTVIQMLDVMFGSEISESTIRSVLSEMRAYRHVYSYRVGGSLEWRLMP